MNILQPKGFITNTTPLIEWEAVDGATEYSVKVTDNVTDVVIYDTQVNATSYEVPAPLPLGTYQIQVTAGNEISIEVIVVTNTVATYTVTGRDGDTKYLRYKEMQQQVRQRVKQARYNGESILQANNDIVAYLAACGDAELSAYHVATITQTPGLGADLALAQQLATQIVEVIARINKRDPQF